MPKIIATALEIVAAILIVRVASRMTDDKELRPGIFTVMSLVAVGSLTALQFIIPASYDALYRLPNVITEQHEYWRLLTAIFVQDDGVSGAIFNLTILALIGTLSDRILGWRLSLVIFLSAGIAMNIINTVLMSAGAGNSNATFALGMTMVGMFLVSSKHGITRYSAIAALAISLMLLLVGDPHGIALLAGATFGALLRLRHSKGAAA